MHNNNNNHDIITIIITNIFIAPIPNIWSQVHPYCIAILDAKKKKSDNHQHSSSPTSHMHSLADEHDTVGTVTVLTEDHS